MSSRELLAALLDKQIPERMGLFEHYWPETLRDFWPEQGYLNDAEPALHFDYDILHAIGWIDTEPFFGQREVVE